MQFVARLIHLLPSRGISTRKRVETQFAPAAMATGRSGAEGGYSLGDGYPLARRSTVGLDSIAGIPEGFPFSKAGRLQSVRGRIAFLGELLRELRSQK